ncbi:laminin subunit alpha-like [Oculina patagonica]
MAIWQTILISLFFVASHFLALTWAANVALHKPTTANATCGSPLEEFYSVVERHKLPRQRILSYCDVSNASLSHNASKMVDGNLATWWQSPASIDKVSITIDLRGDHQKYYYANQLVIRFGEYYRPGQLAFHKSSDYGQTYEPWHYFVSNADECQEKFNMPLKNNPVRVDEVLCMVYTTESVDRNDIVSLFVVGPRGNVNNPSDKLLEWMNVTNIRLDFMSLHRIFDVLAVKWHHYAVREVEVDAYCLCNGQGNGSECFYNATLGDNQCTCQEGACGIDCGTCCPAYNQYPWKRGNKGPLFADKDAACQACNCHDHSSVCVYNETVAQMNMSLDIHGNYSGGGVCQNCQDNTTGINCEKCTLYFYRPRNTSHWKKDACKACNCSVEGTKNATLPGVLYLDCLRDENTVPPRPGMEPGDCICKNNTMGRRCDLCKPGYHNLSAENPAGCQECTCHTPGTVNGSNVCEPGVEGYCTCKENVEGLRCMSCKDTYYDLREDNIYGCTECDCDIGGAYGNICNKTSGQCECKENITQRQCNSPQVGFYFPTLHFISGQDSRVVTTQQGNKTWTTTVHIVQGVNSTGLFTLVLSYASASRVSTWISVGSNSGVVSLESCPQRCYQNLSAVFGEMSLTGPVVVTVTYNASIVDFTPVKVVAIPQEFYHASLLKNSTRQDFLANCSVIDNDMGVGTGQEDFCLAQVFSLTVNYLGGALPCECDMTGSVNGTCQKYGGQCHCKAGVTGRTCDQCIAGFYNFTSQGCSECSCEGDNKICDEVSGQCTCPPNTVGRTCNQCNHTFWGWNETLGCQACNCSTVGSTDLQCNLTTGLCSCQPGVRGDKCTECMDGYKNFSSSGCTPCNCDKNGSLNADCNEFTHQCPCKNNSAGLLCDECKSGYFYLTSNNPEGCTNCVCMGITSNCSSTTYHHKQNEVGLSVWSLGSADLAQISVMDDDKAVGMIAANISTNETLYWKANFNFTDRSLVGAYGGNLKLKLFFKPLLNGTLITSQPKVILKGVKNISIEHALTTVSADELSTRTVLMKESSWVHSGSSSAVSREDFLLVLARLQGLLITASFYSDGQGTYHTSLGDVEVSEVSDMVSDAGRAYDVEQCSCGAGYTGLSCERCARGYHRVNVSSDMYLGKCKLCNCNGHTEDCDPATGQCLNCAHNTTGFHCEICLDGFYGNATDGTPGDCKKCPCESPRTTTALCKAGADGQPRCLNCSEGYEGGICGSCVLGFFGEPLTPGGNCSTCRCNNNSDICNRTTGECINCQHNTTGFNCERCENGTWGNATEQQCQACTCDVIGAHHNVCNHVTGQCECKPHVTGLNCSRCEPNSYNFTSSGCTPCECNRFGSSKLQCNESGICECNNHTLGEKCDLCEWGFYGLPNATCQACNCNETGSNSTRCDRTSGQCNCKPGVTSRMCDRCMLQHTNFTDNGCDACHQCTRLGLQGDLNKTLETLNDAQKDADKVSNLEQLWPELINVEALITEAQSSSAEFDTLVKGLLANITQLKESTPNETVSDLQVLLSDTSQQSENLKVLVSRELSRIEDLNANTQASKDNVTALNATVAEILTQLTRLKDDADNVLAGINGILHKSYDSEMQQVDEELQNVQSASSLAMSAKYNVTSHKNTSTDLNSTVLGAEGSFMLSNSVFDEMKPRINTVTSLTNEALALINQTKNLISEARNSTDQALQLLQTVSGVLNRSRQHVSTGENNYQNASDLLGGLNTDISTLENSLTAAGPELSAANQSVMENATKHAADLTALAEERQSVFNATLSHGARAVDAIKTFEEVVVLGNQSLETSRQVNESLQEIMNRLQNLTLVSSDLQTRVAASRDESEALLNSTLDRDTDLQGLRGNVTSSDQTYRDAVTTGESVDSLYSSLQSSRDSLLQAAEVGSRPHSIASDSQAASDLSKEAVYRSDPVNNGVPALLNQVNRLETKMQSINQSAERAAVMTKQAFDNVQNTSRSLGTVDDKVQEAGRLKNVTANLQAQLRQNMSALEEKLRKAREYVAKIRLALNVQGSTAVQYNPTSRLINETKYTEIKVDFRATRVRGSLFYLSDGASSAARSVALTLESGSYVKFQYNLGTGPIDITNWAVRVRPGHWYTAYATRYEKEGRLTVTDHSRNLSRTYEGTTDIIPAFLTTDFDVDDHIFVGGLPDGVMINKTDRYFDGCIDNIVLNQESLNLWNPVEVQGNRSFCTRRPPDQEDVIPGTSFFGIPEGHVKQKMGEFNITGESEMEFEFRTFHKTAFIASVLNGQNYVYGVYLNDSRVAFYFKTANQTYTVHSNGNSYSDGRWYRVHVVRGLRNASLTIRPVGPSDSGAVDRNTMMISPTPVYLPVGQSLLFGGKDPNSPINSPVSTSFAGGLRHINISSNTSESLVERSLNNANLTITAEGVSFSGLLPVVEEGTRFLGDSYAAVETGQAQMTSLEFTFKTLSPSSVLVYSGEGPFFYVALLHGNIYLVHTTDVSTAFTPIVSEGETLNDGAYHTVKIELRAVGSNVILDGNALSIPDGFPAGAVRLNGSVLIGGVDERTTVPRAFPVINSFEGGMNVLKLNGINVNIFSGRSRRVSLAGVSPELNVIPTALPTTPPPTLPPPTCGNPYPPLRNSSAEDEVRLEGTDYIAFYATADVLNYTQNRFVISVRFRSLVPNGVLLYAANDMQNPTHFIILELVNGRLVFKYNAGYKTVKVMSTLSSYSDGQEYTVQLLRIDQFGAMLVSTNNDYAKQRAGDLKPAMIINSPYYYGGVPPGTNVSVFESNGVGFIGCLGALVIQTADSRTKTFNPRTDRDEGDSNYDFKPCYSEIQAQAGFHGDGHIVYDANYSLPAETDLQINFRTTTRSGLLLSITNSSGPGSVTVEQLDGQIILIFNDERNSSVIRWTDPSIPVDGQYNASFHLCDNKFHRVRVKRNITIVELQVDEHSPVTGSVPSDYTLEHGTFHIGGVPDGSGFETHSGMSHKGLTGCVQTVKIDGQSASLIRNAQLHKVQRGCNAPRTA